MSERLDTLDGLRGIAALLVVVYHFFVQLAEPAHSPSLYPHGNLLGYMPVAQVFGQVGILLFFLISGFVIMMTLERSSGLVDFTTRRMARLWPAMLFCATLSAIMQNTWGDTYHYPVPGIDMEVTLLDYLSSILFFPPHLAAQYLGFEKEGAYWVEGVYWTLWHEVRFYALIAVVFLLSPRAWFLWVWAGLQAAATGLDMLGAFRNELYPLGFKAHLLFQPVFLCWFSLGLSSYLLWSGRRDLALFVIVALAVLAMIVPDLIAIGPGEIRLAEGMGIRLAAYAMIFTPFGLFLTGSRLLSVLRTRPFIAIGLASYPLYLFHEAPGMIAVMFGNSLGLPPVAVALAVFVLVVVFALFVHAAIERPAKTMLNQRFRRWSRNLESRLPLLRFRTAGPTTEKTAKGGSGGPETQRRAAIKPLHGKELS